MAASQISKPEKGSKRQESGKNANKSHNGIFNFIREAKDVEESPDRPPNETAPFSLISLQDDEELFWGKEPDSVRQILRRLLTAAETKATISEDKQIAKDLIDFLGTPISNLREELSKKLHKEVKIDGSKLSKYLPVTISKKMLYRRTFIYIASRLRQLKLFEFHPGIADLMILHAFASLLFKNKIYLAYEQIVDIRECDLTVFQKYLENSQLRVEDEASIVKRQVK